MRVVVLCVGKQTPDLSRHCDQFRRIATVEFTALEQADADTVKSALARLDASAVVIAGPDGAANLIVNRLQRNNQLADTPVLLIPTSDSALVGMPGLPHYSADEAMAALETEFPRRGLVRDDHGGVVLAQSTLAPWHDTCAVRGYVDDRELRTRVLGRLTLLPDAESLAVTESKARWWRRDRRTSGRAFTVSCDQARLTVDGITHPRPQRNRTWWIEPDSLPIAVLD